MKQLLVYPMAFYVLHMAFSVLYMFFSRLNAVKRKEVSPKAFKSYTVEIPDYLVIRGRHFDNQFQAPILFMITCLSFMTLNLVTMSAVYLAWAFVISRLIHSWVYLGRNFIPYRFSIYGLGWVILLLMWGLLMFMVSV